MKLPPRLARRPLVGRVPVPWVALWSAEAGTASIGRLSPSDPTPALFERQVEEGEPRFGEMSWTRQRRAVLEGRCQVCAGRLTRSYVALDTANQAIDLGHGLRAWLLSEPACCATCARVTMTLCPGIRGRRFVELVRFQAVGSFVRPCGDPVADAVFAPLTAADFPARGALAHVKLAVITVRPAQLEPWS